MSTASDEPLSFANFIKGSSTVRVSASTVTVLPLTVRFPDIVTLLGNPTVIVPELSETSISFVVPLNVAVLPKAIAVEVEPSETVILFAASLLVAIDASDATCESPIVFKVAKSPKPKLVLTVLPDSYAKAPEPVATIN